MNDDCHPYSAWRVTWQLASHSINLILIGEWDDNSRNGWTVLANGMTRVARMNSRSILSSTQNERVTSPESPVGIERRLSYDNDVSIVVSSHAPLRIRVSIRYRARGIVGSCWTSLFQPVIQTKLHRTSDTIPWAVERLGRSICTLSTAYIRSSSSFGC